MAKSEDKTLEQRMRSEYNRRYYAEHKDKISEYHRRYYAKHKDKCQEVSLRYYAAHKSEVNAAKRLRYAEQKAEITGPKLALKSARQAAGLTFAAAAQVLGVAASTVYWWETIAPPDNWQEIVMTLINHGKH